jgi:hypothetical protein
MSARPQLYRECRHHIALANRFLRLLALLVAVAVCNPGNIQRQTQAYCLVTAQKTGADAVGCETLISALHAAPTAAVAETRVGYGVLLKAVLLEPAIQMMHANWLVPFWVTTLMQACTFAASCWKTLGHHICSGVFAKDGRAMAAIVPACQKWNSMLYSLGRLLDWQVPLNPAEIASTGDVVCLKPLVALTIFHVWVRLVLLVLLPCALVYCLEFSLKSMFLNRTAADAVSTALEQQVPGSSIGIGLPRQADPSSSSGQLIQRVSQHQQRHTAGGQGEPRPGAQVQLERLWQQPPLQPPQELQLAQQLDQALQMFQPAPLAELLITASGLSFVRCCLWAGLGLCGVLMCWYVSELGVLVLLRGGQGQLVCTAQGRLQIA